MLALMLLARTKRAHAAVMLFVYRGSAAVLSYGPSDRSRARQDDMILKGDHAHNFKLRPVALLVLLP